MKDLFIIVFSQITREALGTDDSLILSQILTQEDWNIVLFAGMERTSHWAALYFVLLMTFGNYILFNLLVAILVEGFSKQDELFDKNDYKVRPDIYKYKPQQHSYRETRMQEVGGKRRRTSQLRRLTL